MQDYFNIRMFMIGALALALAAMLAGPALGKPTPSHHPVIAASLAGAAPVQVIPYLSHGIGVDESQFTGVEVQPSVAAARPTMVVPYLSHGVGVDESQFAGSAAQPTMVVPYMSHGVGVDESQFGRPTPPKTETPVASGGDGNDWQWKVGGVAGLVAAAAALALVGRQRRDVALP